MDMPSKMMVGTFNMIIIIADSSKGSIKIHKKLDLQSHIKKFT